MSDIPKTKIILTSQMREFFTEAADFSISHAAAVVELTYKPKAIQQNGAKQGSDEQAEVLRSWLLDLTDELSILGCPIPLVAVIDVTDKDKEKQKEDYQYWHRKAGDQDWHRSDFSLIVQTAGQPQEEAFLTSVLHKGPAFTPYEIKQINEEDYCRKIEKELNGNPDLSDTGKETVFLRRALLEEVRNVLKGDVPLSVRESTIIDNWKILVEDRIEAIRDEAQSNQRREQ